MAAADRPWWFTASHQVPGSDGGQGGEGSGGGTALGHASKSGRSEAAGAFQRTTCGSTIDNARPCASPYLAVRGFEHAWAAPSIDCSMAIPAKCEPRSIAERAFRSPGCSSTSSKDERSNSRPPTAAPSN